MTTDYGFIGLESNGEIDDHVDGGPGEVRHSYCCHHDPLQALTFVFEKISSLLMFTSWFQIAFRACIRNFKATRFQIEKFINVCVD